VSIEECWRIFCKHLAIVSHKYCPNIVAFVLMSNHFHMIIQTPNSDIDKIMNQLLRDISKEIGLKSNRINHIFGARYKRCLIDNDLYFSLAYKYLYRNPVEQKLAEKVQDYEFSTIHQLTQQKILGFPCVDLEPFTSDRIPTKISDRLNWLNEPYKPNHHEMIRKALRKGRFELPANKNDLKTVKSLIIPEKVDGTFSGIVL
jgi:putative transposase